METIVEELRRAMSKITTHRDLINFIYGIKPGNAVVYCPACGRPMRLIKDSFGARRLVCFLCAERWKEAQKEMETNLRDYTLRREYLEEMQLRSKPDAGATTEETIETKEENHV